ncbi:MAG: M48 family metalloprotease [Candidatus Sericytochromatia bacterium]|nr:M48 family metalloprotease [Candidatus Tanganyikabacteria bacterium]
MAMTARQGRVRLRAVLGGFVLVSAAVAAGCAQLLAGALTAGQALLLTPETEVAIGKQAAEEYLRGRSRIAIQAIQDEVTAVGMAVAARSTRPGAEYSFTAITGSEINAFALPGGPIFITQGLLAKLGDEAQLAGVLAHEVAHVAERHGINRLREALVLKGIAIAAIGDQPALLRQAAGIALDLILKGRDRASEDEADILGIRWMRQAGYDPRAVVDTLQTLAEVGDVPGFLVWASDHPALADRITQARRVITSENLAGGARNADKYLRVMAPIKQ